MLFLSPIPELTPESGSAPSSANGGADVDGGGNTQKRASTIDMDEQKLLMPKADDQSMIINDTKDKEKEIQVLQIEPRQMYDDDTNNGEKEEPQTIINGNDLGSESNKLDNTSASSINNDGETVIESSENTKEKPILKRMETFDSNNNNDNSNGKKSNESKSPVDDKIFETLSYEFNQTLRNEKLRLRESIDQQIENSDVIKKGQNGSVIDSIQNAQASQLKITNGLSASGYDLTQIKDEHGRTVLHLAAAKDQKRNIFYKMLQQAKYLVPELDSKYRTIRDIAVQNGIKNNLQVIDQFIIDCFLNEDADYLKLLLLEGYATLLTVVDSEGNDVISLLERNNITSMQTFIHEAAELQVKYKSNVFISSLIFFFFLLAMNRK